MLTTHSEGSARCPGWPGAALRDPSRKLLRTAFCTISKSFVHISRAVTHCSMFMHISRGVTDDTCHKWTCAVFMWRFNQIIPLWTKIHIVQCLCLFHHTLCCAFSYNAPLHKVLVEHINNFIFVRLLFCSAVCTDIAHFAGSYFFCQCLLSCSALWTGISHCIYSTEPSALPTFFFSLQVHS